MSNDTRCPPGRASWSSSARDGVYKRLNYLEGPQGPRARMEGRGEVVILSSNDYLGLANQPEVVAAGKAGLDRYGAGTASVRFICGTFTIHRELEQACARLVGTESALSFVSCWNANEALPGTVLGPDDLVLSDQLNHASIIDGIRLAKAITKCQTGVYEHGNLADLDARLSRRARPAHQDGHHRRHLLDGRRHREPARACSRSAASTARSWWSTIPTAPGCSGKTGRGTAEHFGVVGEVDIITSTLGKALGGAAGGFVAASPEVTRLPDPARPAPALQQRAPLPPSPSSALAAIEYLEAHPERVTRLRENTGYFRGRLTGARLQAARRERRRSSPSSWARPRPPSG